MRLLDADKLLLNCGTFSLPNPLDGSMPTQGERLLKEGLVTIDDVKMVGETRFIATEKGAAAARPEGTYDSVVYEEAVMEGTAEGAGSPAVEINSEDLGNVDGSESSGSESKKDQVGEV